MAWFRQNSELAGRLREEVELRPQVLLRGGNSWRQRLSFLLSSRTQGKRLIAHNDLLEPPHQTSANVFSKVLPFVHFGRPFPIGLVTEDLR